MDLTSAWDGPCGLLVRVKSKPPQNSRSGSSSAGTSPNCLSLGLCYSPDCCMCLGWTRFCVVVLSATVELTRFRLRIDWVWYPQTNLVASSCAGITLRSSTQAISVAPGLSRAGHDHGHHELRLGHDHKLRRSWLWWQVMDFFYFELEGFTASPWLSSRSWSSRTLLQFLFCAISATY